MEKKSTTSTISAAELLGLNLLNADTEIARHNQAVAAHSTSKSATSSTRSGAFSPQNAAKNPSNFIPLTAIEGASERLDLETVREKLSKAQGPTYWRSLEELSGDPKFQDLVDREFGRQAPASWAPLSRRDFMKVMGAGLALAGLSGCAFQPQEKIIPYVKAPEEIVPGKPLFYATALPVGGGYVNGALAESNMGRPTKIEGNSQHPASLGATDIWMQASVLSMYDPERLQNVAFRGNSATWEQFAGAMAGEREKLRLSGGAGLRVLSNSTSSPTLAAQMADLQRQFPQSQWISYDAVNDDNATEGARLAFGRAVHTVHQFDKAQRILSLDCDFLLESAGRVRYARDFISGRRVRDDDFKTGKKRAEMNRLYVAESTPTITGAMADHRLPLKASQIETLARLIYGQMQPGATTVSTVGLPANVQVWVSAVIADLQAHRGASLVVAGAHQPPVVHAIAHALNAALGNVGKTLFYTDPVLDNAENQTQKLRSLVKDMNAGRVQTLMILGGNPVYDAPADFNFSAALKKVPTTIRLGMQSDETAFQSQWVLPEAHSLEAWSDGRSFEGTTSIVQPLIAPLYENARSVHELLAIFANAPITDGYSIVENHWRQKLGGAAAMVNMAAMSANGSGANGAAKVVGATGNGTMTNGVTDMNGGSAIRGVGGFNAAVDAFEKKWQTILHDGTIPNTASKPVSVALNGNFINALPAAKSSTGLEISFRPDPTLWDGRWANNGWLQELPKPLTRMTWDNAALMSLNTAQKNNLTNEDIVQLTLNGRSVNAPVFVMPGHPDDLVSVHLGGGRTRGGKLMMDIGFNAYALRTSNASGFAAGLTLTKMPGQHKLATVEDHNVISAVQERAPLGFDKTPKDEIDSTQHRDLVRVGDFADYQKDPNHLRGEFDKYIEYSTTADGKTGGPLGSATEGLKAESSTGSTQPQAAIGAKGEMKRDGAEAEAESGLPTLYNNGWPSDPKGLGPDGQPIYTTRKSVNDPDEADARAKYNDPHVQFGYNDMPMPQWAMTIDLNACIGCNACTIGCQAENNIATVGKDQVMNRREMHWIRIDTYYKGKIENPEAYFQPVPCMHCEKAPCEGVCPVEATTHSAEGINEMTYNRCVGTKYCSNNCPYKVRHFNFLQYSDQDTPQIKLMQNPDVTVRARGVMEKCNYCVQRVTQARIEAEREDRPMRDGEVIMACQQACPTDAILFGNIADPQSAVRKSKAHPLNYGLLAELGTQPRTTYLARLRNPNRVLDGYEGKPKKNGDAHGEGAGSKHESAAEGTR